MIAEVSDHQVEEHFRGLSAGYEVLGFDQASGRDEVFRQLVLARIIEPTSKLDSLRVLAETGIDQVRSAPRSSVACRPGPRRVSSRSWPRPALHTQRWDQHR